MMYNKKWHNTMEKLIKMINDKKANVWENAETDIIQVLGLREKQLEESQE